MDASVLSQLRDYFRVYGGLHSLIKSPYLITAIILTALTFPIWTTKDWWADVITVIPCILGVSLAAFTLFLSAGSESFRKMIAGKDILDDGCVESDPSPFVKTASIFLHFLIIQLLALLLAIVSKSAYLVVAPDWFQSANTWMRPFLWFIGYACFLYALMVVLAASMGIYEVVQWFDDYITREKLKEKNSAILYKPKSGILNRR